MDPNRRSSPPKRDSKQEFLARLGHEPTDERDLEEIRPELVTNVADNPALYYPGECEDAAASRYYECQTPASAGYLTRQA